MSRFDPARPGGAAAFYKGHGLGNDYLVVEAGDAWTLEAEAVRRVCHRREGIGSDGLVALLAPVEEPFRLRMFNPDGSEFERSGNGLRVLASWLHRTGRVQTGHAFEVEVGGDRVAMTVHGRAEGGVYDVSVDMGQALTGPDAVGLDRSALEPDTERTSHGLLELDPWGDRVPVHLVSVGNPHCVVFAGGPSTAAFERLGPALSAHPAFAHGTNVQLARVVEGRRPRLPGFGSGELAEIPVTSGGVGGPTWPTIPRPGASDDGGGVVDARIWERGVGPTAASGTSACAVAVAVVRAGLLDPGRIEVRTEGGSLFVDVGPGLEVALRGPVVEVMTGELGRGFLEGLAGGAPQDV